MLVSSTWIYPVYPWTWVWVNCQGCQWPPGWHCKKILLAFTFQNYWDGATLQGTLCTWDLYALHIMGPLGVTMLGCVWCLRFLMSRLDLPPFQKGTVTSPYSLQEVRLKHVFQTSGPPHLESRPRHAAEGESKIGKTWENRNSKLLQYWSIACIVHAIQSGTHPSFQIDTRHRPPRRQKKVFRGPLMRVFVLNLTCSLSLEWVKLNIDHSTIARPESSSRFCMFVEIVKSFGWSSWCAVICWWFSGDFFFFVGLRRVRAFRECLHEETQTDHFAGGFADKHSKYQLQSKGFVAAEVGKPAVLQGSEGLAIVTGIHDSRRPRCLEDQISPHALPTGGKGRKAWGTCRKTRPGEVGARLVN